MVQPTSEIIFSILSKYIRVRNRRLHNLFRNLTKGIIFWDYKTKWSSYDLRISISAPKHLQDLADDIESGFYSRGRQEEIVAEIKRLDPNAGIIWGSIDRLEKQLGKLEAEKENRDKQLDSLVQQANNKLRG